MSKVDELREKYPRVSVATFTKLVNGDFTPTKKYLEYMLKIWTSKIEGIQSLPSAEALLKEVKLFDELLPYNTVNKDIYSSEYRLFNGLKIHNQKHFEIKEEKTFNRDEHARVIYEDDDILYLEPKTHKGSLKYGSNTRWCTASKNNPHTFTSYSGRGCLTYLIDKKNSKGGTYSKIAIYNSTGHQLTGEIEIYNQNDSRVSETTLINNGWDESLIVRMLLEYRIHSVEWLRLKRSRDEVNKVMVTLKNLNLDNILNHLEVIKGVDKKEYSEAKLLINKFISSVEKTLPIFEK
jgi:hypothetical protein